MRKGGGLVHNPGQSESGLKVLALAGSFRKRENFKMLRGSRPV